MTDLAYSEFTLDREERRSRDTGIHYWLADANGEAVAYAKVYDNYSGHAVSLCDIETRPDSLRRGYATHLLSMIADEFGVPQIHHDGGYTEAGCRIAHLLDRTGAYHSEVSPTFSSMTFVSDWATRRPKFF